MTQACNITVLTGDRYSHFTFDGNNRRIEMGDGPFILLRLTLVMWACTSLQSGGERGGGGGGDVVMLAVCIFWARH